MGSISRVAIGVGDRRFASSTEIGQTWLSATDQIKGTTVRLREKWLSFAIGVLPAPILAMVCPGDMSFKAVIAAFTSAAQTAYSLTRAEYELGSAIESVSIKVRAAALSDTYANQGARASSILPFTSALSGLCAATAVAAVELLPYIPSVIGESVACAVFPAIGALLASAASISKACAEIDAEAASAAAASLSKSRLTSVKGTDSISATIKLIKRSLVESQGLWKRFREWLIILSKQVLRLNGDSCKSKLTDPTSSLALRGA